MSVIQIVQSSLNAKWIGFQIQLEIRTFGHHFGTTIQKPETVFEMIPAFESPLIRSPLSL